MARKLDLPAAVAEAVIVLLMLGLVFVGGLVGWIVGHERSRTHTVTVGAGQLSASGKFDPHVAAGAHDFVQFACAQCHGPEGRGGASADVPALTNVAKAFP